jgi:diguanylate cyclase (GGDEF)-like protein
VGSLVLAIALFNFIVGFALAVYLHNPAKYRPDRLRRRRKRRLVETTEEVHTIVSSNFDEEVEVEEEEVEERVSGNARELIEDEPTESKLDELPPEWRSILEAAGVEPESLVDAAIHVLKLEVQPYRERLVFAEHQLRAPDDRESTIATVVSSLREVNLDWIEELNTAAQLLAKDADEETIEAALEEVVHDQAFHIKSTWDSLETVAQNSDMGASKRVINHICKLIQFADELRDQLQEYMARLLTAENRLGEAPAFVFEDPATKIYNRAGFSFALHEWRRREGSKNDGSVIAIDVDRFGKMNEYYGTATGDVVIKSMAILLEQLAASEPCFVRLARVYGQTMAMLLGDPNLEAAVDRAERIRQSIEATSFDVDGGHIEFTISTASAAVPPDVSPEELLARLKESLRVSQKKSRNRSATWRDGEVCIEDPRPFQVSSRVIRNGEIIETRR